jgi:glutamate synthase (NADPH/NADH) large chain
LRGRVRVQTDGGLKTGLDVVKAAILGAESFGFGTGPMVALGCKYLRICHLNNCATGVATQNEKLRRDHFIGLPDMVVNYFKFVAEETRELMASLGIRQLTDLIGRTDLLDISAGDTPRQGRLNLSALLSQGSTPADAPRFSQQERNPSFDKGELAEQMVVDALAAITAGTRVELDYTVRNVNRSIGARLSGEIAKAHGGLGLPDDTIRIQLTGSAGQSFGVWNHKGLTITLEGDANDYVGKGMGGGRLVIYPPRTATFEAHRNTLIGNTCLYGATGGELYAAGMGGERFGVRNSGALAVVEGIGDHGCEYMTGGTVIVLGDTGLNFGAGMSGGMAFVVDDTGDFMAKTNKEMVELTRITSDETEPYRVFLKAQTERHLALTGSARAKALLADFDATLAKVWLVKPKRISIEDLVEDIPGQSREAVSA